MRALPGRARDQECTGEKGQALVLFAVGLVGLLGLVGLSVDIGLLAYTRTDLQKTADAAALAGAQELARALPNTEAANQVARTYAHTNRADSTAAVSFAKRSRANDVISVTAGSHVTFVFLGMIGVRTAEPSASASAYGGAAASIQSLGGASVMPWAINNDAYTGYGVRVGVQPANASGGYGTYNLVSLDPPGGQSYADAIVNGVKAPINVGGKYRTNAFDGTRFSQTTISAMQGRIAARPKETWKSFQQGSPRVVFLPVANGGIPNPPTPVAIQTFRAFFLDSTDYRNSVIYGMFVEAIAPGGGIPTPGQVVPDLGVYTVGLIK